MKSLPLSFQHVHPNYQGLGLPRIGIEYTISQIDLLSNNTYSKYLAGNIIRLYLEQI